MLEWTRGFQGAVSHVYRGPVSAGQSWSGNTHCVDFANPGTVSLRVDEPAAGELFFYLVTAANACGESHAGLDSNGIPRQVSPSCPLGSNDFDLDGYPDAEDNCPQHPGATTCCGPPCC